LIKLFFGEQVRRLLDEGMDVNVAAWGPKSKGVMPLPLLLRVGMWKSWMNCSSEVQILKLEQKEPVAVSAFSYVPTLTLNLLNF